MNCWDRNTSLKFWAYFLTVCFDFLKGYKIHVFSPTKPKFCMYPLNLLQIKAQTRKLRKAIILFSKVGESKQIRRMAVTPVLTMLTSHFWSHFASLDCLHGISKNPRVIISFIEKLKNAPFNSFNLIFLILKPLKLMILYSSEGQL